METQGDNKVDIEVAPKPAPAQMARMHKIKAVLIAVVVVGLGCLVAWLLFFANETVTAPADNQEIIQNGPTPSVGRLHAQLGSTVYSFNPQDKQTTTLTSDVPDGAVVMDVYEDSEGWRLYYRSDYNEAESGFSFGYMASDGNNKAITETLTNLATSGANAETNTVFYVVPAEFDELDKNAEAATTRTYVFVGGEEGHGFKEVYRSKPYEFNDSVAETDFKKYLYFADDISSDGKTLLFGLRSCYQCDGSPRAVSFELDIESGETTGIYAEPERIGLFDYDSQDRIRMYETRNGFLGELEGNLQESYSFVEKRGSQPSSIAQIDHAKWSNTSVDDLAQYISISQRAADYPENYEREFVGIYRIEGPDPDTWSQVDVDNFDTTALNGVSLGKTEAGCLLVLRLNAAQTVQDVGAICAEQAKRVFYSIGEHSVDDMTYKPAELL